MIRWPKVKQNLKRKRNTYDVGIYKRLIYGQYTLVIGYIINLYHTNNTGIIYDRQLF